MKNISLAVKLLLLSFLIVTCKSEMKSQKIDKSTVNQLDLNRYMGVWYEIARYPHKFEKDLAGVTATYSLLPGGKITVINQGYENNLDGKLRQARGKAKLPDKKEPGKLKVSFFWIFYADYFVFELDSEYKWAVIGSSSDNYLWILSRTPKMDEQLYQKLLEGLKNRGYDLTNFNMVLQPEI